MQIALAPNSQTSRSNRTRTAITRLRIPLPVWFLLAFLAAVVTFGKGPTYLYVPGGAAPIFWGEITLLITGTWALLSTISRPHRRASESNIILTYPISLLLILGGLLLVFDFPAHGIAAVRDAAIAYYAIFYFIGTEIAAYERLGDRVWRVLQGVWFASFLWNLNYLLFKAVPIPALASIKGNSLFDGSGSENAQHMFLAGLLFLLAPAPFFSRFSPLARYVAAGLAFAATATTYGRGVKVAALLTLVVIIWLLPSRGGSRLKRAKRPIVVLATLGLVSLLTFLTFSPNFGEMAQLDRFSEVQLSDQSGTDYWRTSWWENIAATVSETNPLFGLGFGYNLASLNPFVMVEEGLFGLRAPHNITMSYFGHMGLIGAGLWLTVVFGGIGKLILRLRRAAASPVTDPQRYKEHIFWIAFLVATVANSSFGVLMDGPVLGIPFWFLAGFAARRSLALSTRHAPNDLQGSFGPPRPATRRA